MEEMGESSRKELAIGAARGSDWTSLLSRRSGVCSRNFARSTAAGLERPERTFPRPVARSQAASRRLIGSLSPASSQRRTRPAACRAGSGHPAKCPAQATGPFAIGATVLTFPVAKSETESSTFHRHSALEGSRSRTPLQRSRANTPTAAPAFLRRPRQAFSHGPAPCRHSERPLCSR